MPSEPHDNGKPAYRVIGTRPVRHDGVDKVNGRANYGADVQLTGTLAGWIVRSPHAHARITAIDTSAAEALEGGWIKERQAPPERRRSEPRRPYHRFFACHGSEIRVGRNAKDNDDLTLRHSRGNDLAVNPTKGKQLTNMRASGTDENIVLTPPIRFSLEQALDFIEDDELVEVTPESLRLRKKLLTETERKRAGRA